MSAYEITKGVYGVGVLNPNLRVFDIIMETEFGTTYNAYLVRGEEKTALIETVHASFFEEYMTNISQVCDVGEIDYIILNHCEPDHSGSLRKLLERNPGLEVIVTTPGAKYLAQITNIERGYRAVRDGEAIDLGGKTLTFFPAPFLHWPDSMFTYCAEDKLLFSCDFLGAHYCEAAPTDESLKYPVYYEAAFAYYYRCIFGPFKKFVLAGLNKIDGLEVEKVCVSHGPILIEGIAAAKEKYRRWSAPIEKKKDAVILYVSAYGCTQKLAETAAETLKECGWHVKIFDIIAHDISALAEQAEAADLLMFGSPTINQDALKPVWDVISAMDAVNIKGKACGVFGSYGWSGEGVPMLAERLSALKLKVHGEGFRANFLPSEKEIEGMRAYTAGIAG